MIYDHFDTVNHFYRITLKIYRDCMIGNAQFDGFPGSGFPAIITVRDGSGAFIGTYNIGAPVVSVLPPSINNPCIQAPNTVCVEEGVYTTTLTLPPKNGGYYIIYQRCCRNATINNLVQPADQGSLYFTKIPGPEQARANSSPHFIGIPPIYLCNNQDFTFDHTAFDPDGDQLVYSFCEPFLGADGCCPYLNSGVSTGSNCVTPPSACPTQAPPPPYLNVNYLAPYSGSYPIASNPAFTINVATGQLTGRPNLIGQFVVGICVKEYRNGQLINTHYRDFQFNVKACVAVAVSAQQSQSQLCRGTSITFTNQSTGSTGQPSVLWDFGVPNTISDTSVLFNPTYNFPDTGKYTVTLIANAHKPCADTSRKDYFVYPSLDIFFLPPAPQCLNNNSFDFAANGQYDPRTQFIWTFDPAATPSISTQRDPKGIVFKDGGNHPVTLVAKFGKCSDTATAWAGIFDPATVPAIRWDTTVVVGEAVPLNASIAPKFTYTWTPVTDFLNCTRCQAPDPVSTTLSDISYTVLVEDSMGCGIRKNTYSIHVEYKTSLDLPTAFTPNGDGNNDVIYVEGWGLKRLFYFKVFNRWGQLLFQTDDLNTGWDGRFNGVVQNMETYVYQVAAETYLKETPELSKTGTFKLIR